MTSKLSVVELKEKLHRMDLPTSGTKAELLSRLLDAGFSLTDFASEQEENGLEAIQQQPVEGLTSQPVPTICGVSETDLLRREQDLAEREIQILRREMEILRVMRVNNRSPLNSNTIKWKDVKDMIGDYDGSNYDFDIWNRQLRKLIQTYTFDHCAAKALLCSKLTGKVLKWYQTRSDCIEMNYEQLLDEIKAMFGQRVNGLVLRREFDVRKWKSDETFTDYLHDKVTLGKRVPISDDELIDYIIDGIPNQSCQTQARIQCFQSTNALLKAFAKVSLPCETTRHKIEQPSEISTSVKRTSKFMKNQRVDTSKFIKDQKEDSMPSRCYNCNSAGHYARNCQKPKRERGTCYICGKFVHQALECRKQATSSGRPYRSLLI